MWSSRCAMPSPQPDREARARRGAAGARSLDARAFAAGAEAGWRAVQKATVGLGAALTFVLAVTLAAGLPAHAESANEPAQAPVATPASLASPASAASGAAVATSPLTRDRVDTLARALRDEPSLMGKRKSQELRLKPREDKPPPPREAMPAWLRWLGNFVSWLADAGRWLVWGLLAVAVALLLLRLRRLWQGGVRWRGSAGALHLPGQVRGLDIRPEALPDDVGAAAWALWQGGQRQQALSLLYRGALSRLVHRHEVPIRSSSTEGECLRLAQPRLPAPALAALRPLVAAWMQAVYAERWPDDAAVQALCRHFSALDTPRPPQMPTSVAPGAAGASTP